MALCISCKDELLTVLLCTRSFVLSHTASPTLPFPGASLGREGGRGGGGGGGGLLAVSGVPGRAGDEEPAYQGHFIKTPFS